MKRMILVILLVLAALNILLPITATADEMPQSGIVWYLGLYNYTMPKSMEDRMHALFAPQELDCGDVQVILQEILYDGYWIYISASVAPTSPDTTLIVPGSAEMGDRVSGGNGETERLDDRTFYEAAVQDNKKILRVYICLEEFKELPFYLLDHRQDANNSSTLISGAHVNTPAETLAMHWLIKIYEMDTIIGSSTLVNEYTIPVVITPLGDAAIKTYTPLTENSLPLNSMTLIQTALTTYAIPAWESESNWGIYVFSLLDEKYQEISQGVPVDAYTFAVDQLTDELIVRLINTQTSEAEDVVCCSSDSI